MQKPATDKHTWPLMHHVTRKPSCKAHLTGISDTKELMVAIRLASVKASRDLLPPPAQLLLLPPPAAAAAAAMVLFIISLWEGRGSAVIRMLRVMQGSTHSKPVSTSATFHLQIGADVGQHHGSNMSLSCRFRQFKTNCKGSGSAGIRMLRVVQGSAHSKPVSTSGTFHLQNQAAAGDH